MQTKLTKILISLIVLFFLVSSISYAATRIYWTCIYHPQQRTYSTRKPGVQGCSYSPDKQHVWTEHTE